MPKKHARTRRLDFKLRARQGDTREKNPQGTKLIKPRRDWEIDGVQISDHAVVRYLEICGQMDVTQVRAAMVAGGRGDLIRGMRSGKVPIQNGAKMVVRDGLVVTVVKRRKEYTNGF